MKKFVTMLMLCITMFTCASCGNPFVPPAEDSNTAVAEESWPSKEVIEYKPSESYRVIRDKAYSYDYSQRWMYESKCYKAYTSPDNVTQEIANDVYSAYECFLADQVFTDDYSWVEVSDLLWNVYPDKFGEYNITVEIFVPSPDYDYIKYEISSHITVTGPAGHYIIDKFSIGTNAA